MASRAIKDLHPVLAKAVQDTIEKYIQLYPEDPRPFVSCTYRGPDEQDELYNYPRDGKDNNGNGRIDERGERVTNARGGQSPHNFLPSLAFDIAFAREDGKLDWSITLFRKFANLLLLNHKGIKWGGHFKSIPDAPHYELLSWKAISLGMNKVYRLQKPYMADVKIKSIQKKLGEILNASVVADGIFGPDTDTLVRLYQKRNKLKVDGIVGPATLKKLGI